jgi:hypothetical protein
MNCCDYNCNQGRDCPVRQERIERVAKIGKKMQAKQAITKPVWRHLKMLAKWMLIILFLWLVYGLGLWLVMII